MKLHIGVASHSGLAHSAVVTAANVHDKHPLPDLLHGAEQRVDGDSAYSTRKALIASKAPPPQRGGRAWYAGDGVSWLQCRRYGHE